MLIRRVVAIFGAFLALSAVLVSAAVAPAVAQTGDGDWVGTVGADGYALVGMNNGADVAQFPVARFVGPSSRLFWEDPSTDVRALESPDQSHRVAARWYSSGTVSMSLIFHEAYAGPLNLYGVDFDDTGRVQNVKVTHGSTVLGEEEWSNFSAGYWMETSIDVPAGAVVQIQATRLQGNESVISGVPRIRDAVTELVGRAGRLDRLIRFGWVCADRCDVG